MRLQLFIRHHAQGLSLTAEGQHFLREARALLLQAEEVENAALTISARVAGPLEIGCLSTLFPLVDPRAADAVQGALSRCPCLGSGGQPDRAVRASA